MMRFDIWQGDTEPFQLTLTGISDLTNATATLVLAQANGAKRIEGPMPIDDPIARIVHYSWGLGDTDVPGVYRGVVKCVLADGNQETFPSDEPFYLVIRPAL